MKAFGMRAPVVAAVVAAVLLVLLGGQSLYTAQRVDKPLEDALSGVSGVRSVAVDSSLSTVAIDVTLGAVPNLMDTYQALDRRAKGQLNDRPYRITLDDQRTKALSDDYDSMNAILEEGIATGKFTDMKARVQERASELGLDEATVLVDINRVYVQLREGKNFLDATLERDPQEGAGRP